MHRKRNVSGRKEILKLWRHGTIPNTGVIMEDRTGANLCFFTEHMFWGEKKINIISR